MWKHFKLKEFFIMISTTAVFDHSGRSSAKKLGPIEIRVIVNRTPYYINTGVRVYKNEFQFGQVVDRADAKELNERIGIISKIVEEEVNKCIIEKRDFRVDNVRSKIFKNSNSENSEREFIDWAEEQVNNLTIKETSQKRYKALIRRLKEYGKIAHWSDINVESIYNFDAWLHTLDSRQTEALTMMGIKSEKISDSGVFNYHKCMKSLLSRAVLFGKIGSNPYEMKRGMFKRGESNKIQYLTQDEMDAFCSLHPKDGTIMALAHDVFILQMFTGLAYSDIMAFDASQYRKVDGSWVNVGSRIKTGVPYISQLLPPVVEILEKYNWKVPFINNADYNHALKGLGIAAGISTPIHSHMARHTFATWMLRNGVRIEHVSRMLGHTNIAVTQRYAKVLAEDIRAEFDRIEGILSK